jgi:hypothetical protein
LMFPEDSLWDPNSSHEERAMQCPACGQCWHADGKRDDASEWWPIKEEDAYCPCCQVEGEA